MEELDREGQRLLQCIRSSDGFSGRNCISGSADFQSLVPKVNSVPLGIKPTDETPNQYINIFKKTYFSHDTVRERASKQNYIWKLLNCEKVNLLLLSVLDFVICRCFQAH